MLERRILKLRTKNGFTLIELLCSMAVFSILFMATLTLQIDSLKLKKYNKQLATYSIFIERLKNTMIYNTTYNELQELSLKRKCYITRDRILSNSISDIGIVSLFSDTKPLEEPYLILNVEDGKVLKVNLKLYTKVFNNIKVMECEFYKGKYNR